MPPFGPLATATGQPVQQGITPLPKATLLPKATFLATWLRLGSMLAEPSPRDWGFTMLDQTGAPFASCCLEQRQLSCT